MLTGDFEKLSTKILLSLFEPIENSKILEDFLTLSSLTIPRKTQNMHVTFE